MMSSKRNLIVVALVAIAVVVGYTAITGKFPPRNGTEGTIGAAKAYRAEQMKASDVSLKDAKIQAFLQTDLFHKVATNPKFRQLIKNPHFRTLSQNKAFLLAISDPSAAEALSHSKAMLASADLSEVLKSKKFQSLAESEKLVKLLENADLANLVSDPGFVEFLKDPGFDELMETAEAQKVTTVKALVALETEKKSMHRNLAEMEKKKAFQSLVESNELQEAATQADLADLAELLETTNIEALLTDDSFQAMLHNPKLVQLFAGGDEMAEVIQNLEDMAREDGAAELFAVFADPSIAEAFSQAEMEEIASADLLEQAVTEAEDR